MYAVLDGKKVKPVNDVLEWANFLENNDRHVGLHVIGEVQVSTVFLGLDHGFGGPPVWFETMIFGGEHDGYEERYATWEDAEIGHAKALALVIGAIQ